MQQQMLQGYSNQPRVVMIGTETQLYKREEGNLVYYEIDSSGAEFQHSIKKISKSTPLRIAARVFGHVQGSTTHKGDDDTRPEPLVQVTLTIGHEVKNCFLLDHEIITLFTPYDPNQPADPNIRFEIDPALPVNAQLSSKMKHARHQAQQQQQQLLGSQNGYRVVQVTGQEPQIGPVYLSNSVGGATPVHVVQASPSQLGAAAGDGVPRVYSLLSNPGGIPGHSASVIQVQPTPLNAVPLYASRS